ncbi:uncharacterized protein C5orf34 homolog isoform X2 [Ambystoma mexicanum]|uniref:uncharacterized protein C5orf34 homolog isoform X2 n=1 Tax=Ambystoma mexicanum TaxID=8296 RepID=UPI0037E7B76C
MRPESEFVLYEDDSVEVQYSDGSRLQLSPCGTEFVFERALPASAHPLQQPDRIRQRTQFVISSYKERVLHALEFRNRFSVYPFLPISMIPCDRTINVFTSISDAKWPNSVDSHVESQADGSVKVSSLDGHAHLYLTKLQQEFTVEFLCRTSQQSPSPTFSQVNSTQSKVGTPGDESTRKLEEPSKELTVKHTEIHLDPSTIRKVNGKFNVHLEEVTDGTQTFIKHAIYYTWVVQQHCVSSFPEEWKYPLSLAIEYYNSHIVNTAERTPKDSRIMECQFSEQYEKQIISALPKALPLACYAPHLHRWSFYDFISQKTQDTEKYSRPGLIKVVLCNGRLYRFMHGSMRSVEIFPGDGTYFISHGSSFGRYFTHCRLQEASGRKEEIMYAVTNLPPDTPESQYSVWTIISKAARTLEHCYRSELSLTHGFEICCWKTVSPTDKTAVQPVLLEQSIIDNVGRFSAYSDNRVIAHFLDGLTLHMIWKFTLIGRETKNLDTTVLPSQTNQDATTGWCQILFPEGGQQLIQLACPGLFESHVKAVTAWCMGLDANMGREMPDSGVEENWSVFAELEKIQRFNFLLENSSFPRSNSNQQVPKPRTTDDTNSPSSIDGKSISAVLEKTSKVIQDIDLLLSSSYRK